MSPSMQEDLEVLNMLEQPDNLRVAMKFPEWMNAIEVRPDAPKEARELLANQQNWDTAREIVTLLKQIRFRVYRNFWEHIEAELNSRMSRRDDCAAWKVVLSLQREMTGTWLSIMPPKNNFDQFSQVCAEDLVGKSYFGVYVGERSNETRALEPALRQDKFKANKTYAGYRYFRDVGLSAFAGLAEDLLRINTDNHTPARPVATSVADFMWSLFERHSKEISALNFARARRSR